MFQEAGNTESVVQRIKDITGEQPTKVDENISFSFDFGHGKESGELHFLPHEYGVEPIKLPDNIGLVVMFASQGPMGVVKIGEDIKQKMTEESYILDEFHFKKIKQGIEELRDLGNN